MSHAADAMLRCSKLPQLHARSDLYRSYRTAGNHTIGQRYGKEIMTRIIEKEKVAYGRAMKPATTTRMADDGRLAAILRTYLAGWRRAAARRKLVAELQNL